MINTTILNYKVSELLGEGGMAKVYYGENSIGHKVAIKVLKKEYAASDELRERFINEAKIMMKLDHQNIRKMYNVDDIDGQLVIIMEYLEGETLSETIHSNKYVDLKYVFNKCKQALIYSHSRGIVHRDIKPSNIFITSDGSVKIMDFGIAKSDVGESYTRTGQTMGTIAYMSPEQVKDPKRVTRKTDIYSLGVTFYHALMKNPPYDLKTDSEFSILTKIVQESLDLAKIPQVWQNVLSDCLEKDPLKRKELSEIDFQEKTNLVGEDFEKTTMQPGNGIQERPPLPNPQPLPSVGKTQIIDNEPIDTHSQVKESKAQIVSTNSELELATIWQRILNGLLDLLVVFGVYFILGRSLVFFDLVNHSIPLVYLKILLIVFLLYYITLECLPNKQSIGKLITKTKVVRLDGNKPSFGQIAGRSFLRLIPFEWISVFIDQKAFHDSLSNTMVVKKEKR